MSTIEQKPAPIQLGSAVAWVVKPIVRLADGTLGTDLNNCAGCQTREQQLNRFGDAVYNWLTR